MLSCHVKGHSESKKHKKCVQHIKERSTNFTPTAALDSNPYGSKYQVISIDPKLGQLGHPDESQSPPNFDMEVDPVEYPVENLWEDFRTERMYEFTDYFEEMQGKMERGESLLNCIMQPLGEELGLETDESDYGGDDEDEDPPHNMSGVYIFELMDNLLIVYFLAGAANNLHGGHVQIGQGGNSSSPGMPFYPWKSMGVSDSYCLLNWTNTY